MSTKKKTKRKINIVNLWAVIVSLIAAMAMIVLVIGIIFLMSMLKDKPSLNMSDFEQAESSVIYDSRGDEIASLGSVIRQNVEYDEIPNCVVDAFVAIEDSRFFEHNGFDVPRFTKAMLENIRTLSFGQGGSTFTMQLVKNTYFVNDDTGQQAARSGMSGIKRKVQEIALAMELENYRSKQDIFTSYINKLNFGGSNIRGIQKASQYYFGKDISECNLVEGALLAGVINAPNYYNPFYNLEAAQDRVTEVLYQMYHHGYISRSEYELAKAVRIEDILKDPYSSSGDGDGIPYQAYIDAVVSEVIDITGLDPYNTTMHIYTHMIKGIQEQMDDIQAGIFEDDYLYYPDEYFEVASVCIENSTGKVVGILGGRNYANGGQLLLNHATEQYKQPGSSIKPILDYALAFENLGWATDHVLTDRPMWLDATNSILVYNDSGTYVGDVTLKQALGQSINTCAIQTLQKVLNEKKYEYVVNYAQSLGYDFNLEDFNVQYAVGGSSCEVSPYQHAGAYTAIMNYGVYNTPHTIERIEFTNGKSPITPVYESTQVISEAAAYLTTELMKSNVSDYGGTYNYVKSQDYTVYGKTGTTDYGTSGKDYGIPSGAIKDGWLVAATSEYTTATWVGYEKAVVGQQSYILKDYYYNARPQGKIAHLILEAAYKYGNSTPSELSRPSDVTSITHIIGTWPYAAYQEDMDPSLRTTGLIKSDSVKLVTLPAPTIENMSDNYKVSLGENGDITIEWPEYPDESKLEEAGDVKDISLKNAAGDVIVAATGTSLFDYTKLYGPIRYMADITISGSQAYNEHIKSKDKKIGKKLNLNP
ncbi:MAG: transglycosylase domain-containing protein, partial [Erysipelotrichaceae bacterium]|nr:transglycosylase domain-containing protein [Erysipelotrichaceae bacterium]